MMQNRLTAFLLTGNGAVVIGVSGGADSLCLLHLVRQIHSLELIVAHFDHQLRPEAKLEAEFVRGVAEKLKLPFVSGCADVRGYAMDHKLSLEEAARTLRYRFLFEQARAQHASAVAVGHTADDQVETILMHFLRGAGLAGLKGMAGSTCLTEFDREITLVRPILHLWRHETEAYCREHGLQPVQDPSNSDETYFRNRLRHSLIPELEKYNPRFKDALLHTAAALQGDHSVLQEALESAWKETFTEKGDGWVVFDRPKLAKIPVGLRRNLIRRAAESLRPDSRDFGFDALDRAAMYAESPSGDQIDFINGMQIFVEGEKIYLATHEAVLPSAHWPQVSGELTVDGDRLELGNGWVLSVEQADVETDRQLPATDNWSAWLDADLTGDRLSVRPRRAGDSFSPLGMNRQTVKMREFYINVKIPRRARAGWPLVCTGEQIAWVPGFRLAHPFRITEKTKRVIKISIQSTKRTQKKLLTRCPGSAEAEQGGCFS
jgi:tRNA(Ile)-lysidine synthase